MQSPRFPRGSEWRKWDLHVHTPYSALSSGFGSDFDAYVRDLFTKAVEKEVAVIGITDYFSIEGYKQLREAMQDLARMENLLGATVARQAQRILLLPNVELRTTIVISRPGGTDSRVNFHVIFSDELPVDLIEEHFLRGLKFTAEGNPDSQDERWPLTEANLKALGQRLKMQHPYFRSRPDLFIGMMNAVIAHDEVSNVLESQRSRFGDRYLLVVPADEDLSACAWDGQAHLIRKVLIQKSHMLFSSNPGTREWGLGRKGYSSPEDFKREFKSLKPCIHGSDAHEPSALFEPAERRYLWIKADPTFQGLQQLRNEPESRVHIGESVLPLKRVRENPTKYMTEVRFARTELARPGEKWFSGAVPLNSGLVAVIGNKGSGKSALTDLLGLLGDTRAWRNFSFLDREHFLKPKGMLGSMFTASAEWCSGAVKTRALGDPIDETNPELVKYIPQRYLEAICSELKEPQDSQFYQELMQVIYSHVAEHDRLGKATLMDLIEHRTNLYEARLLQLTLQMPDLNRAIVQLEEELTEEHRRSLEARLASLQAELKAHDEVQPQAVTAPTKDATQQATTEGFKAQLAELVARTEQLDREILAARSELADRARRAAAAERLLARIANLEHELKAFHAASADDAAELSLDTSTLVALAVNRQPILDAKERAENERADLENALNERVVGSLAERRAALSDETAACRSRLDEPDRRYQQYLHDLTTWQKRRDELVGSRDQPETVEGLVHMLEALRDTPSVLASKKVERFALCKKILEAKFRLLEEYRRLYTPVQDFIEHHPVSQQQGALEFTASVGAEAFLGNFLEMIHQGRKGSFQGEREGRERLREMLDAADFSTDEGTAAFLQGVQECLETDRSGGGPGTPVRPRHQLRQGIELAELYDFLYGLGYLGPRFELRWQGKPLSQLSAGERGSLLLVFFLLIDKRDVPLIIDQPEENLDNQTVATMVVPAIKYSKDRRQIVIVTHNPNLAVVCDADQVIHAHIDKTDGNRVTYTSGSIEDATVARLIVDVLEGTKPAFDLRDAKYQILERA